MTECIVQLGGVCISHRSWATLAAQFEGHLWVHAGAMAFAAVLPDLGNGAQIDNAQQY